MTLSEKLYKLRRTRGYSQEELAEKLDVSRQAVSKWERGESAPEISNLIAISKLYGIPVDELAQCINGDYISAVYQSEAIKASAPASHGISLKKRPENQERYACEGSAAVANDFVRVNIPVNDDGEIYPKREKFTAEVFPQKEDAPKNDAVQEVFPGADNKSSEPAKASVQQTAAENKNVVVRSGQAGGAGGRAGRPGENAGGKKKQFDSFSANNPPLGAEQAKLYKKLMHFPFWAVCLLVFLFFGGVFELWEISWMTFLLIPLYYTAIPALFYRNPYCFCYPVLAAIMFLLCAYLFDFHDTVTGMSAILFFGSIPLYYTLIAAYKKKNCRIFAFPVVVVILFLLGAIMTDGPQFFVWLFATIPFYYFFAPTIDRIVFKKR
ncbi:MAG: helix-turn-helix domain-containing protein [Oscillospiraceae bacterium]|nr:helix-turn-helix domain-containing protein [Oscillospiraceae bacterium]